VILASLILLVQQENSGPRRAVDVEKPAAASELDNTTVYVATYPKA
jgi:hypothetical protein